MISKVRSNKKIKNILLVSEGGLGKCIASTAIVKRLNEEFPDKRIIILTGYPEIFMYNPRIYKTFNFANPLHFYDDFVNEESYLIKLEPYTTYEYMQEEKHLIEAWCDLIGIKSKGAKPELYFLDKEKEAAEMYVEKLTNINNQKKKFVLFQWIGGITPKTPSKQDLFFALSRMHKRSLEQKVAQEIVNKLIAKNYVVGAIQKATFPKLEGTEVIEFPLRNVLILLQLSKGFIGIDSFLQHAAAALNVPGVVCWSGTNPKKLGYEEHKNLTRKECPTPFCHRPDTYTFDIKVNQDLWNCPHNEVCRKYNSETIVKEYFKLVKDEGEVVNEKVNSIPNDKPNAEHVCESGHCPKL